MKLPKWLAGEKRAGIRAARTFVHGFAGSLAVTWTASAADLHGITQAGAAEKLGLALVIGGVSAGVSAVLATLNSSDPEPPPSP